MNRSHFQRVIRSESKIPSLFQGYFEKLKTRKPFSRLIEITQKVNKIKLKRKKNGSFQNQQTCFSKTNIFEKLKGPSLIACDK